MPKISVETITDAEAQRPFVSSIYMGKAVDLNAKDNNADTALVRRACRGHLPFVKYLVEQGAAIDAKNKYGRTALTWIAYNVILACSSIYTSKGLISIKTRKETLL